MAFFKYCQNIALSEKLGKHEENCKHCVVACPLSGKLNCPEFIKINDLKNHIKNVHDHPGNSSKNLNKFNIVWVPQNPNESDGNPTFLKDSKKRTCLLKSISGQDFVLLIETDNKDFRYKITPLSLEKPKNAEKYKIQITAMNPGNPNLKMTWVGKMSHIFDEKEPEEFFTMYENQKKQLASKVGDKMKTSFEINLIRCAPKKTLVQKLTKKFKKFQFILLQ